MTRFAKAASVSSMTTMNVSLPDELKTFVDERVTHDGYGSTSEYVRDLIRRDRERGHLRNLVLEGRELRSRCGCRHRLLRRTASAHLDGSLNSWRRSRFNFENMQLSISNQPVATTSPKPTSQQPSASSTLSKPQRDASVETRGSDRSGSRTNSLFRTSGSVAVGKFPYLLFYLERETSVDVWRLLHTSRDIPASLREPDA